MSDDWRSPLPKEGECVFNAIVGRWNTLHTMLRVALSDAVGFRTSGELICARQQVRVSADLVTRLACNLEAACALFRAEGRHFSVPPPTEPLDPSNFRGETARRLAGWNMLLHQVLLSSRSRYLYKARFLENGVQHIVEEYQFFAQEIAEGTSTQPALLWSAVELLEYDLTTCLGEAEVLLKSFLHALHPREGESFETRLEERAAQLIAASSRSRKASSILSGQLK